MKKIVMFSTAILMLVSAASAAGPYKPGDIADDFTLKNVSGSEISLAGIENSRGFIVVFMCNTCPVVKAYEDRIIDLNKKFSAKGYPVVAINSNDKIISIAVKLKQFLKTKALLKALLINIRSFCYRAYFSSTIHQSNLIIF